MEAQPYRAAEPCTAQLGTLGSALKENTDGISTMKQVTHSQTPISQTMTKLSLIKPKYLLLE